MIAKLRPISKTVPAPVVSKPITAKGLIARSLAFLHARSSKKIIDAQNSAGNGYAAVKDNHSRRDLGVSGGPHASADSHCSERTGLKILETLRYHDRNSCLYSGLLDRAAEHILGSKFTFKPLTGDEDLNKVVGDYITERMKKENCSADKLVTFQGKQQLVLRALWNDGDGLNVKRSDGSMLAFEADQIITPRDHQIPKENSKKSIFRGVQRGDLGEHEGYYVAQRPKPNDWAYCRAGDVQTTFVKAEDAIYSSYRKRENQGRGIPFCASILSIFDRTDAYIDYETLAAEINAMPAVKVTDQKGQDMAMPNFELTADELKKQINGAVEIAQEFRAGSVLNLAGTGVDVGSYSPDRPNHNFDPFVTICCRLIGVAVGFPLELLLLDYSKSKYTASQMLWDQIRKSFEQHQVRVDDEFNRPWYNWQITRGIANRDLPADSRLYMHRSVWPIWSPPDPKKNADARKIEYDCGVISRKHWQLEKGLDPVEVAADRQKEADEDAALAKKYPPKTNDSNDSNEKGDKNNAKDA